MDYSVLVEATYVYDTNYWAPRGGCIDNVDPRRDKSTAGDFSCHPLRAIIRG